jgi:hypothetical protein
MDKIDCGQVVRATGSDIIATGARRVMGQLQPRRNVSGKERTLSKVSESGKFPRLQGRREIRFRSNSGSLRRSSV